MKYVCSVFGGVLYGLGLGFMLFAIIYAFWGMAISLVMMAKP
jgi:hypothetical protein